MIPQFQNNVKSFFYTIIGGIYVSQLKQGGFDTEESDNANRFNPFTRIAQLSVFR